MRVIMTIALVLAILATLFYGICSLYLNRQMFSKFTLTTIGEFMQRLPKRVKRIGLVAVALWIIAFAAALLTTSLGGSRP